VSVSWLLITLNVLISIITRIKGSSGLCTDIAVYLSLGRDQVRVCIELTELLWCFWV